MNPPEDTARGKQTRQLAKWCAYALALAAPGALLVLPLWLLRRHWATRVAWEARTRKPRVRLLRKRMKHKGT